LSTELLIMAIAFLLSGKNLKVVAAKELLNKNTRAIKIKYFMTSC
jgi:hypothetical protein